LSGLQELAESKIINTAVVAHDSQVLHLATHQSSDEILWNAAQAEASNQSVVPNTSVSKAIRIKGSKEAGVKIFIQS